MFQLTYSVCWTVGPHCSVERGTGHGQPTYSPTLSRRLHLPLKFSPTFAIQDSLARDAESYDLALALPTYESPFSHHLLGFI
jgi:hypothetical protein